MNSPQPDDENNRDVKTILILAANPAGTSRLQLDKEIREIDEGLKRGNKREQFNLEQKWAVRQRDFYRAILDYQPQIVHFSGHGASVDGIVLENEADEPAFLNADALSSMFELFATKGVECVLLNACYSEVQAKAISQHVNYVIGMNRTIGDKAAIAFSEEMAPQERDFINASVQQRSKEQEEIERRRRRNTNALISVLVAALILLGFIFFEWQQAEKQRLNAEVSVQSLTTDNLFASNYGLDALLSGLKTAVNVKKNGDTVDLENRTKAIVALQQVVYGVKEHNRLEGYDVVFSPDGKTIASGSYDKTVILWNMDLDDLLIRGCNWAYDYLKNNPNVKDDDRHLCDDVLKRK